MGQDFLAIQPDRKIVLFRYQVSTYAVDVVPPTLHIVYSPWEGSNKLHLGVMVATTVKIIMQYTEPCRPPPLHPAFIDVIL